MAQAGDGVTTHTPWSPDLDRELGGDGQPPVAWRPVVIESPYAGDLGANRLYLDACIRDCLDRGETPYASHRMLTGALRDKVPGERAVGIAAGFGMAEVLARAGAPRVVYVDLGISAGMRQGIAHARHIGQAIERRSLPNWSAD